MRATLLLFVAAALAGCSDPGSAVGFDEKDPSARMRAIRQAADAGGESGGGAGGQASIKPLIHRLESDDPAERLVAIHTLERLTGEDFGYDHAASRPDRDAAIRRWADWYNQRRQELSPKADH